MPTRRQRLGVVGSTLEPAFHFPRRVGLETLSLEVCLFS
jgi:hypothetical protein